DGGAEELLIAARLEPLDDQAFGERAEALAPDGAGAHDLDEGPEHAAVVDDAVEDLGEQAGAPEAEHSAQEGGEVLHVALAPGVERGAGDELGLDLAAERQDGFELLAGGGVVGGVE